MVGFHPATGRVGGRQNDDDSGSGPPDTGTTLQDDEDDTDSDGSDFDQPYHETALEWYARAVRRRARQSVGLSSSSSSSGSDDSSGVENEDDGEETTDAGRGGPSVGAKRKERDRAARSAQRPLAKWLAEYPLVAARCCLSSPSSATTTSETSHEYGTPQFNHRRSPLPAREQEIKKLRHILRRLSRKQQELQAKFMERETSAGSKEQSSACHNAANDLSLEQMMSIERERAEAGHDPSVLHSFLPQGTGVSFIDAVMGRGALPSRSAGGSSGKEPPTSSRLVLELTGPPRSGMTSILLAVAARYVASTSNLFLDAGGAGCSPGQCGDSPKSPPAHDTAASSGEGARPAPRRGPHDRPTAAATEPRVVILDLEQGVHAARLLLSVREAVLRRWEETAAAREWRRERDAPAQSRGAAGTAVAEAGDASAEAGDERRRIERALASCLGRIHVVRPRDFTYLGLVATLEVVMRGLDREKASRDTPVRDEAGPGPRCERSDGRSAPPPSAATQRREPPTLILIDALTTLSESTRFQESLPTTSGSRSAGNSGLSDRNEFYRQLIRLREEHDIAIVGASRSVPNSNKRADGPTSQGSTGRQWSGHSLWDKMVSHRISLHRAVEGTSEDQAGYAFVAALNATDREGARVFPYSVTAGGIASR